VRVTVPHTKSKQEVIWAVDRSFDDLLRGFGGIPVKFVSEERNWQGSKVTFSILAKVGILSTPIRGTVEVTDLDLTMTWISAACWNGWFRRLKPAMRLRAGYEGC
jgi:hypothetical protein